jgi:hypothetical protein
MAFWIGLAGCRAESSGIHSNRPFDHVEIAYLHAETGCSYQYSPIDFCDERHISEINAAIEKMPANFNKHYILLSVEEWPPSPEFKSLMAIDTRTGVVYPVPIDDYSGHVDNRGRVTSKPKLTFSIESNRLCIQGAILVYRATTNGNFCFDFNGDRFSGYHTEYMY